MYVAFVRFIISSFCVLNLFAFCCRHTKQVKYDSPFAVAAYAWLARAKCLVWKRSWVRFKPVDLERTPRGLCLSLTYSPAETKRNKQIAASSQKRLSCIWGRTPPRRMTGPGHRWHISLLCASSERAGQIEILSLRPGRETAGSRLQRLLQELLHEVHRAKHFREVSRALPRARRELLLLCLLELHSELERVLCAHLTLHSGGLGAGGLAASERFLVAGVN